MTSKRTKPMMLAVVVVTAFVLASAPTTSAHGGNHGTIKVHDEMDADPDPRIEPRVDCDFWIEGFNMDGFAGELIIYDLPPIGTESEVLRDNWTGVPETDGDGFRFLEGPYTLPSGHYRVEAFSDEGHPGDHGHFAKAKMFWVDCDQDERPECPPGSLEARANGDGSITVDVNDLTGDASLFRGAGGNVAEKVADLNETNTQYVDTNTTAGVMYTYTLVIDDQRCDRVEVTAIPVFPSAVAGALAIGASLAGYVALRRRH